jgi:hypothetical protein
MLATLPEGDNLSWNLIREKYLPELPTAKIPIIIPKMEIEDTFGLTRWWIANETGNFILILKNKDESVKLQVRRVKEIETTPLKETFEELDNYYIALKRWDKKDLDAHDYSSFHRAIKRLLLKANGDKEKIKRAMVWCHNRYAKDNIDWSLDTVIKKWPEAVREIKSYEKYIRK